MPTLPSGLSNATGLGVYSPSGSFSDSAFRTALFDAGIRRLQHYGFSVRESARCRGAWHHMSAPAADRVQDLHDLVADPDVHVVLPSIGGHVAAQLLPLIDFDLIAASGTALFGFSDNSIVPLVTTACTGAVTFHGPCDVTFGFGRFDGENYRLSEDNILDVIRHGRFDVGGTVNWRPMQTGAGTGTLLGGNLRAISRLAGTTWWPDWHGKIMFIEAGDELHSVEQDLVQLSLAGAFDGLAGMIIGRASRLPENFYRPEQIAPLATLLLDIVGLRDRFPIITEADIGHDVENVTIPLGVEATLLVEGDKISCKVQVD
ncbi:muramoyltetrapeptide carboxypeptidase [Hamadaea flava]|uniref:LD-carboxypeptidase n=1 Tax=Hamadaea flava TaxID=1742688 RepID=A0ABV8LJG5_9ACTN|nr:LD-carboxypeptidase [Hamadaea flava]MCP2323540.1 muramoyltetrapeptide carboxypeptidase [Hamadaea flava]